MAEPREILERSRTVAVVGASTDESKPSHSVPARLQRAGFNVIPVNPSGKEILGRVAAKSLSEIDEPIDVVEVFRPAEEAPEIAREAVAVGAKTLWLQLGIRSDEARRIAEEGGLDFIEDHCMGRERDRYDITKEPMDVVS
ncbi:MAG: CoA-binding protein [Actinomycetota bacterium]